MHYTEHEIWHLTPRQFVAQLNVHEDITKRMHSINTSSVTTGSTGYIDQIPGW